MRSGDGRRCSVFVSVSLSQDGRNNQMLCLNHHVDHIVTEMVVSHNMMITVKVADAVALNPDAPLLATRGEQSGRHGARRHAAWSH